MDIKEIKTRLPIETVLMHYGLKMDKNNRLHCPFHEDKKPSMQVYPKTGTVYCFSTTCAKHGQAIDQIDLVMYLENCTKHEAIVKCESLITGMPAQVQRSKAKSPVVEACPAQHIATLTNFFTTFRKAIYNSPEAKAYLKQRHLWAGFEAKRFAIGYNSGQFHHGSRKANIDKARSVGLLKERRPGNPKAGYQVWAKDCLIFPLKNARGEIVSLYGRSLKNDRDQRHFYLKNRQGLFPGYPPKNTKKIILTESLIDCLSIPVLPDTFTLALYGTNGLTAEHITLLNSLPELNEIIFFLDGDEAGEKAVKTYGTKLADLPVKLSKVNLLANFPGQDVNSILDSQPQSALVALINRRTALNINPKAVAPPQEVKPKLNTSHPRFWTFQGHTAQYFIAGGLKAEADKMKVSLHIQASSKRPKYRKQLDLYEAPQVDRLVKEAAERLALNPEGLEADLVALTEALEKHREARLQEKAQKEQKKSVAIPGRTLEKCLAFWKAPNLMRELNSLIGRSGVVGEEKNRLFLFGLFSSYKMEDTLHALVQGSSGSGKTHLIHAIARLMPEEDVISLTRVTENSLYNYPEHYLRHKLVIIEDFDGMGEEAQFAWRKLQSKGEVSSSTSGKDEQGNIRSYVRVVRGPIASGVATTHGAVYEDNMSRCFLIAIDESREQTSRVIDYQNQRAAGQINKAEENDIRAFLQHGIRCLKPLEVVNPYAGKLQLPPEAHKLRRLNDLYQSYVKQVTLLHQYQRPKDPQGRLITQKEDLEIALDIMFESIYLKVDELDGSLRQFFESLKDYVEAQETRNYQFTQRELRHALNLSKSQLHRYIQELQSLEYIQAVGGYQNRGLVYKIIWWDDMQKQRAELKNYLQEQLNCLDDHSKAVKETPKAA